MEAADIPVSDTGDDTARASLALFEDALELPAAERADFVETRAGVSAAQRARALRLLRADATPPPILRQPLCRVPVTAAAADPDRRLGRYALRRLLGSGGMGQVFLARDELLDRDVAVKMFADGWLAGAGDARRLLREARAASAIADPHVCPVYDFGEDEHGRPYIVMGYCDGETLAQRLTRGALTEVEAVAVALQAAHGLRAAHDKGIVHRDIKPGNIMLTSAGAKLLDFGIADAGGAHVTRDGRLVGTLAYMSPERAAGERGDRRSDIWSLGAVLYEMVAGTRPFDGDNDAQLLNHILHGPVPSAADASPALQAVIAQMLQREPDERYATMSAVIDALGTLPCAPSSDDAAVGRAAPPLPRVAQLPVPHARHSAPAPSASRRRAIAAASLLGLVLTAIAFVVPGWRPADRGAQAAAVTALEDDRVVVLPFRNQTGVDSLRVVAEWAADWVGLELMQAGVASVVPAGAARSAAERLAAAGTAAELDLVRGTAQEFGARIVVSGSVFREGDRLEFHVRLFDAASGQLVRALEPVDGAVAQPSSGFAALRTRTVSAVATLTGSSFAAFTALQSQPPTYQAYQEFSRGSTLFAESRYVEARPYFERAARLDPSYTLPLIYLALAWGNAGDVRLEDGRIQPVDSILRIVEARRASLPLYDLNFLDFSQAVLSPHPDWERALRAARELHRIAPGARTDYDVGANLVRLNRPREAIAFFRTLDPERGELRSWVPYWSMLTRAHHMLGEHEAELAAAVRARTLNPRIGAAHAIHFRALAALGHTAALMALVDSALAGPPLGGSVSAEHAVEEALLELWAHGHHDVARHVHTALTARYEQALALGRDEHTLDDLLFAHVTVEAWDAAGSLLSALLERKPDDAQLLGVEGIVLARTGRIAEARARMEELAIREGVYDMGRRALFTRGDLHPRRWAAEIAAAAGDPARAVSLIRAARADGLRHGTWLHAAPGLRYIRDYAPLEALLEPAG